MKIAVVDVRMEDMAKRELSKHGFYVLEAPPSKKLSLPLSSHPDMLLFCHGKNIISSSEYCDASPFFFEDITRLVSGLCLTFTEDSFSEKYPHDAIFNALVIGKKIFLKKDSISDAVLQYAERMGLEIIGVKQGYPACTVLPLGDSAAITSDVGMARVLSENGIEVTKISSGGISLPPYEYGFIGGAAGVYKDKIYFIGDYKRHPDARLIEAAVKRASFTPVSLSSAPLSDLGRIIFIDDDI